MNKVIIAVVVLVIAGLAVVGISASNNDKSQSINDISPPANSSASDITGTEMPASQNQPIDTESEHESVQASNVTIENFAFKPAKITIKKGTTVTWTNKDNARHDVMPTGGGSDFKPSELLARGESYSFTFNNVGTYTYLCSPHPNMTGTVEVTE